MRRTYNVLIAVAFFLTCGFRVNAGEAGWSIEASRLGILQRATGLSGLRAQDLHGKKLGSISDLLLDLKAGRAVMVLMDGNDPAQLTPVPATAYAYTMGKKIVFGIEQRQFTAAPRVPQTKPVSALEPDRGAAISRHFNQPRIDVAAADEYSIASRLIGTRLSGRAGEPLGTVVELMLDLQRSRIVYLVVEPLGNAGSDLYLVPPVAVQPVPGRHELGLSVDRQTFIAGPHFQKEFWADLASPQLAADVCGRFGLKPVVLSRGGDGRSDQEINQAIMAELANQGRGSATLAVMVATINGRVTLTGSVKDEEQKRTIVAVAERIAGAGNVEDKLEARRKSKFAEL